MTFYIFLLSSLCIVILEISFALFNLIGINARLNSHYKAWSYKKKKLKKVIAYRKSFCRKPTVNKCLLFLNVMSFRLQVKGKHSIGREFQSIAMQGKKLVK